MLGDCSLRQMKPGIEVSVKPRMAQTRMACSSCATNINATSMTAPTKCSGGFIRLKAERSDRWPGTRLFYGAGLATLYHFALNDAGLATLAGGQLDL